ncbi:MAG: hypothetical protein ACYTGV_15985 [Planctomycetota bacterium]|jgi:hypothetical protein
MEDDGEQRRRNFGRSPGRVDLALYAVWLIAAVFATSNVLTSLDYLVNLILFGSLLVVLWCLRGIFAIAGHWVGTLGPRRTRWEKLAWLALPLLFSVGGLLQASKVSLHVRFALSEPSLRAAAREPDYGTEGRRVGLFRVSRVVEANGHVHLTTANYGMIGEVGFVYSPDGEPGWYYNIPYTYEHLRGPWWTFRLPD